MNSRVNGARPRRCSPAVERGRWRVRYARFEGGHAGHAARVYHSCSVMLDPALLRERLDDVRARPRTRSEDHDADLDRLARVDARRRAIIPELEVVEPPR